MRALLLGLAGVLMFGAIACGDDAAAPGLIELTIVNVREEAVAIGINGAESTLDPGDEDTISLEETGEYTIIVTGVETGIPFISETMTVDDLANLDYRIVVSGGTP